MSARTPTTAAAAGAVPAAGAATGSTASPRDERSVVRRGGGFAGVLTATHEALSRRLPAERGRNHADPQRSTTDSVTTATAAAAATAATAAAGAGAEAEAEAQRSTTTGDVAAPATTLADDPAPTPEPTVLPAPALGPDPTTPPDPALVAVIAASALITTPGSESVAAASTTSAPHSTRSDRAEPTAAPDGAATSLPALGSGADLPVAGSGALAGATAAAGTHATGTSGSTSRSALADTSAQGDSAAVPTAQARTHGAQTLTAVSVHDHGVIGQARVSPKTAASGAIGGSRATTTLSADQVGTDVVDGTRDLPVTATTAASVTSQPPGVPVSATTSWFGLDLTTTTAAAATTPSPVLPFPTATLIADARFSGAPVAVAATGDASSDASDASASDSAATGAAVGTGPLVAPGPAPVTGERAATATPAVPVGEQVARQINAIRTTADGTHRTVVRLDPEHLGPITLTVSVRAGRVRLSVSGSPQALAALNASMGDLRDQLGSAGLGLDGVSLQPSTTGSSSSSTDGRSGFGTAFAATAAASGDGSRRAPEGRGEPGAPGGSEARGSADARAARGGADAVVGDPPTTPQPLPRNGFGVAAGVDVRI
jgi:hypothetical protein